MFRIGFVLDYGDSVRESWSGGATSERRALYPGADNLCVMLYLFRSASRQSRAFTPSQFES